jgi:hypothetical protein
MKIKWQKPKFNQDQWLQIYTFSIFITLTFLFISLQTKATVSEPKMTVVEAKRLCSDEGKTEGKDLADCIKEYIKGLRIPGTTPTPSTQN